MSYEKVSSDPIEQAKYELFAKGYDAAILDERERVVALLEAWVADDNGDFNITLQKIKDGAE
jgi:hypothetical protein